MQTGWQFVFTLLRSFEDSFARQVWLQKDEQRCAQGWRYSKNGQTNALNQQVVTDIGVELCGAFAAAATAKASVPIFHHLDHCKSIETCRAAVDHSYPSVMIDASMHPLERNIEMVRDVVGYAHAWAVHVEAEVTTMATARSFSSSRTSLTTQGAVIPSTRLYSSMSCMQIP
jgi:hypothetical protein